jgi:hypothetical protein
MVLNREIEQSDLPYSRRWPGYDGNLQEADTDAAAAEPSEHTQKISLERICLERHSINRRHWISDNGLRLRVYHDSRGWRGRLKNNPRQLRDRTCKYDLPNIGSIDDARRSNATPQFIAVDHRHSPTD